MKMELARINLKIRGRIKKPLRQGERYALEDFGYNLGVAALLGSTLLRKHNQGDKTGASKEFGRWVFAGGRKLRGLVRRRAAEVEYYEGG